MQTVMDIEAPILDAYENKFIDNVRKYGWAATHVAEDKIGPGFSYTTGFWLKFQFPELIIFSLPRETAHQIFWNFYKELETGRCFHAGVQESGILSKYNVVLKSVSQGHFREYFGWNRWFYRGDSFQAQQIILPDKSGLFPWDTSESPEFVLAQQD